MTDSSNSSSSASAHRPMVARVGREKQLYSETGARVVAGTVVLNQDRTRVLLISSQARRDRWIIPKGGVEVDEPDCLEAALRETWEEAGAIGKVSRYLGPAIKGECPKEFWDAEIKTASGKRECEFHFYELILEKLEDEWPESAGRDRKWATYEEARMELLKHNRRELAVALEKSSLKRES